MKKGLLIIISGAAGTGKGTIVKSLLANNVDMTLSVSATTRKPRPGETHGVEYFFKTNEEFNTMINNGDFIEYTSYNGNFYGTPKEAVLAKLDEGKNVILEIEVEGAGNAKKSFPDAITIFLAPPSKQILYERLKGRGTETADVIDRRMRIAEHEFSLANNYEYIVVNDVVESATARIESIITAEKLKTQRQQDIIADLNK